MEQVIEILKLIQNTSSLNEKQRILRENKDNELLKKCLVFLLDGNTVTGISTKKIDKMTISKAANYATFEPKNFSEVIDYLKTHNTGTDVDVATVRKFICNNSKSEAECQFYEEMVTKKFRLGADSKLINKAIPGLIEEFNVQLGTSIEKVKLKGNELIYISRKLNGCFYKDTKITMADGSVKKIKDIVPGDIVMSFDEKTHKISPQKVLNTFRNGLKPKSEWIKIISHKNFNSNKIHVTATKNHQFFTPNGWKYAGNLKVGDEFYYYDYEFSETQKSVLLGLGLGDGSVAFDNPSINSVRFNYCKKKELYHNFFHKTCDLFDIYTGTYQKAKSGYGTDMERCTIKSINTLPDYFYNKSNVLRTGYTFTEEVLNNITPLALAIYYIDDGSKLPCKKDGSKTAVNVQPRVIFATHRHNKREVYNFSDYLDKKYGITNRVARYKVCLDDAGYQIEVDANGTRKLFDLIAKYIPYDLREQKLSKEWHKIPYEDWTQEFGYFALTKQTVEEILLDDNIHFGPACTAYTMSYDLEVENNHTYFANGFAVHNCRMGFIGTECRTRQNKKINGVDHIIKDLQAMGYDNMFVDGELLYKNKERLSDSEAFQKGTGIANSKSGDKSQLKFVIFDMFPLKEFWSGKSKEPYSIRSKDLDELEEKLKFHPTDNIEVVPRVYHGYDHSKIWEWLQYAEDNDWEGCCINLDKPYECKRTKSLIKVKQFYDATLRVIGYEEGSGKNKGALGSLIVKYKDGKSGVGYGYSDQMRKDLWEKRDELIGKLIDIKYKEETKDKNTGLPSLQFAGFICFREDYDKVLADDEAGLI